MAWVAGFLAVTVPGGIGVREGVLIVLLGPLLGAETAAVIAATHRVFLTALELASAALGYWVNRVAGSFGNRGA
jgi:uncharacterized membrane protein YbhN (UPF0104 family)